MKTILKAGDKVCKIRLVGIEASLMTKGCMLPKQYELKLNEGVIGNR